MALGGRLLDPPRNSHHERTTRVIAAWHPERGVGNLGDPVRRLVIASSPQPALEEDDRELVVPADAVERVDEVTGVVCGQVGSRSQNPAAGHLPDNPLTLVRGLWQTPQAAAFRRITR